jgi:small-conductance mechanosensitive channel/CRP-like cAMP-binding protein
MNSTASYLLILAGAVAGIFGLRSLSQRARFLFEAACLAALSAMLYEHGAIPLSAASLGAADLPNLSMQLITAGWWLLAARVIAAALYFSRRRDRKSREGKLVIDLAAAAVYVGAGLIVLKSVFTLPIGGLVATSGIVAVVLGLALQSTLSDVFSGIAVGIEAPFKVGDRIYLDDSTEGQIVEMNWRSICVQTDGADIAVIPNSVVAKLKILNRSVPTRVRTVSAQSWCPATSDPDTTIEVLEKAAMLCFAELSDPSPSITLTRMGNSRNLYTIKFSVSDTKLVDSTRSQLLRHARKQLYHAGLLFSSRDAASLNTGLRAAILPVRQMLNEIALFECLSAPELDELARSAKTRLLEPEEVLFTQGASDDTMYVIASGVMNVTQMTESGAEVMLGCIGAGEYLGEVCLLTGSPHAATGRARTHCYIHQLSRDSLEPLLRGNPELTAAFDKSVRRGLAILDRSVAARASRSVGSRLELLDRIRTFFRFHSPE